MATGCTLEVVCSDTQPGEDVGVTGASEAFGCWEPGRVVRLATNSEAFPRWSTTLPAMDAGSEFKFVIVQSGGGFKWEPLQQNRHWPPGVSSGSRICAWYGEAGEQIEEVCEGDVDEEGFLSADGADRRCSPSAPSSAAGKAARSLPSRAIGCTGSDTAVKDHRASPVAPGNGRSPCSPSSSPMSPHMRLRGRLLQHSKENIRDYYDLEPQRLGEGAFGVVSKARRKKGDECDTFAVKTVVKAQIPSAEAFLQEFELTRYLDHPNVVRLYDSFEDERSIYLILELCEGAELFDRIVEAGRLTEHESSVLAEQMLRALCYLHKAQVAHRDLKPENFLLKTKGPVDSSPLKLIDFGLSKSFATEDLKTACGTSYYVAPEVISGHYTEACDMWSCGTIIYCLLCGRPPFGGRNDREILQNVRRANYSLEGPLWLTVSDAAKDLLRGLLELDVEKRLTAEKALEHPWIRFEEDGHSHHTHARHQALNNGLVENLRAWRHEGRFKRAAMTAVAGQLNEDQLEELREAFIELDENGDGFLSLEEMHEGLIRHGLPIPDALKQIVAEMETSAEKSGSVCYSEFISAAIDRRAFLREEICWHAFRQFDIDHDGVISQQEIASVLSSDMMQHLPDIEAVKDVFASTDLDGDGKVSFEEFMQMMRTNAQAFRSCDDDENEEGGGK